MENIDKNEIILESNQDDSITLKSEAQTKLGERAKQINELSLGEIEEIQNSALKYTLNGEEKFYLPLTTAIPLESDDEEMIFLKGSNTCESDELSVRFFEIKNTHTEANTNFIESCVKPNDMANIKKELVDRDGYYKKDSSDSRVSPEVLVQSEGLYERWSFGIVDPTNKDNDTYEIDKTKERDLIYQFLTGVKDRNKIFNELEVNPNSSLPTLFKKSKQKTANENANKILSVSEKDGSENCLLEAQGILAAVLLLYKNKKIEQHEQIFKKILEVVNAFEGKNSDLLDELIEIKDDDRNKQKELRLEHILKYIVKDLIDIKDKIKNISEKFSGMMDDPNAEHSQISFNVVKKELIKNGVLGVANVLLGTSRDANGNEVRDFVYTPVIMVEWERFKQAVYLPTPEKIKEISESNGANRQDQIRAISVKTKRILEATDKDANARLNALVEHLSKEKLVYAKLASECIDDNNNIEIRPNLSKKSFDALSKATKEHEKNAIAAINKINENLQKNINKSYKKTFPELQVNKEDVDKITNSSKKVSEHDLKKTKSVNEKEKLEKKYLDAVEGVYNGLNVILRNENVDKLASGRANAILLKLLFKSINKDIDINDSVGDELFEKYLNDYLSSPGKHKEDKNNIKEIKYMIMNTRPAFLSDKKLEKLRNEKAQAWFGCFYEELDVTTRDRINSELKLKTIKDKGTTLNYVEEDLGETNLSIKNKLTKILMTDEERKQYKDLEKIIGEPDTKAIEEVCGEELVKKIIGEELAQKVIDNKNNLNKKELTEKEEKTLKTLLNNLKGFLRDVNNLEKEADIKKKDIEDRILKPVAKIKALQEDYVYSKLSAFIGNDGKLNLNNMEENKKKELKDQIESFMYNPKISTAELEYLLKITDGECIGIASKKEVFGDIDTENVINLISVNNKLSDAMSEFALNISDNKEPNEYQKKILDAIFTDKIAPTPRIAELIMNSKNQFIQDKLEKLPNYPAGLKGWIADFIIMERFETAKEKEMKKKALKFEFDFHGDGIINFIAAHQNSDFRYKICEIAFDVGENEEPNEYQKKILNAIFEGKIGLTPNIVKLIMNSKNQFIQNKLENLSNDPEKPESIVKSKIAGCIIGKAFETTKEMKQKALKFFFDLCDEEDIISSINSLTEEHKYEICEIAFDVEENKEPNEYQKKILDAIFEGDIVLTPDIVKLIMNSKNPFIQNKLEKLPDYRNGTKGRIASCIIMDRFETTKEMKQKALKFEFDFHGDGIINFIAAHQNSDFRYKICEIAFNLDEHEKPTEEQDKVLNAIFEGKIGLTPDIVKLIMNSKNPFIQDKLENLPDNPNGVKGWITSCIIMDEFETTKEMKQKALKFAFELFGDDEKTIGFINTNGDLAFRNKICEIAFDVGENKEPNEYQKKILDAIFTGKIVPTPRIVELIMNSKNPFIQNKLEKLSNDLNGLKSWIASCIIMDEFETTKEMKQKALKFEFDLFGERTIDFIDKHGDAISRSKIYEIAFDLDEHEKPTEEQKKVLNAIFEGKIRLTPNIVKLIMNSKNEFIQNKLEKLPDDPNGVKGLISGCIIMDLFETTKEMRQKALKFTFDLHGDGTIGFINTHVNLIGRDKICEIAFDVEENEEPNEYQKKILDAIFTGKIVPTPRIVELIMNSKNPFIQNKLEKLSDDLNGLKSWIASCIIMDEFETTKEMKQKALKFEFDLFGEKTIDFINNHRNPAFQNKIYEIAFDVEENKEPNEYQKKILEAIFTNQIAPTQRITELIMNSKNPFIQDKFKNSPQEIKDSIRNMSSTQNNMSPYNTSTNSNFKADPKIQNQNQDEQNI